MSHVVLLGDSIFDNASYVPGEPSVIQQLRAKLPGRWQATLAAVDGAVTGDVERQLAKVPRDATHLIVSAGGNDALSHSSMLVEPVRTVAEGLARLAQLQSKFRHDYRQMVKRVLSLGRGTALCTVYDAIPALGAAHQAGLSLFNDVILRKAFSAKLPVLDLRLTCNEPADFSALSPIEPSSPGGEKIAAAIVRLLTTHDFESGHTTVYG